MRDGVDIIKTKTERRNEWVLKSFLKGQMWVRKKTKRAWAGLSNFGPTFLPPQKTGPQSPHSAFFPQSQRISGWKLLKTQLLITLSASPHFDLSCPHRCGNGEEPVVSHPFLSSLIMRKHPMKVKGSPNHLASKIPLWYNLEKPCKSVFV